LTFDSHWGLENQGAFPDAASKWTEPVVSGEGKSLQASWSARNVKDRFTTKSTLTVGFNQQRGMYTYDIESELEVLPGEPFLFRYGFDFEHHTPLDPFRWQYLIARRKNGELYHRPVYPIDPGPQNDLETYHGLRVWYGRHVDELHVAPAIEYGIQPDWNRDGKDPSVVRQRKLNTAVCAAFYGHEGTDVRTFQNEHLKRDLLMPVPLAAFIVSRIARSLAYAHQTIIHRDISPENLLLNLQGVAKLSDFGVAVDHKEQGMIGKVSYMSPEQIGGEVVDLRTDIYSLGLVLYLLLTGVPLQKVPMRMSAEDRVEYARKLLERPLLSPSKVRTDVPEAISEICMKMLARDRDKRYGRAESAARDLEQKYLYAKGFGPTNNSLQAYLEIFDAASRKSSPSSCNSCRFSTGN